MLNGIKQYDSRLLKVIQKYGCLFLCFAEQSPINFEWEEGIKKLNSLWKEATEKGIISDDLNGDGDYDDAGEAEIIDHNALAKLFNLNVRYDGIHHDADESIPKEVSFVFGQFFWKGGHFVIINKRKEVTFDSFGYSNTVKNGTLKSMRYYYAV